MGKHTSDVVLRHDVDSVAVEGHWIWDRDERPPEDLTCCLFRKRFAAAQLGAGPVLRISADSRYRAYLNGKLISRGPCRGTLEYYNYETVPLEGLLADDDNVLAVEVRWYGRHFPQAEIHRMPGLWAMLGGADNPARLLADETWRVFRTEAYAPDPIPAPRPVSSYCVVDPCEDVDFRQLPIGWTETDFEDGSWTAAYRVTEAYGRYQDLRTTHWFCELAPRTIPPLAEAPITPAGCHEYGAMTLAGDPRRLRSIEGELHAHTSECPAAFWAEPAEPLELPGAGTHYVILNMGQLVTAYPRLTVDAPGGTMVEFRYTEALSRDLVKGVRDDPAAGAVEGYFDTFTCRAGETVTEPFVWRTFRFIRIAIHHPDGPATLKRLETIYSAYPFEQAATFESPDPLHKQLWDISWRTARLCAHEHYEDCPYYEQLQYVSDTRLQALISYMVAGDFRLARQALRTWAQTRRADGVTKSRSPSNAAQLQVIPQFSLIWIGFLEDFYLYSGDADFAAALWPCVESVLAWFEPFDTDGFCADVPYWVFCDWSYPRSHRWCGSLGELNLRRIGALQAAARMADGLGKADRAECFRAKAAEAADAVRKHLWSEADGLFCDEPDGTIIGEHPSLLAILHDVVSRDEAMAIIDRLASRDDLARTTIYYSYYTFRTFEKLGLYDQVYRDRQYNWTDQIALHATTWFEKGGRARSDCHAWGAWIMCDLLTSVLGIRPASPGFATVRIAPHLMDVPWARGSMPTVRGAICVDLKREGEKIHAEVCLPEGVTGVFVARDGTEQTLTSGPNSVESTC